MLDKSIRKEYEDKLTNTISSKRQISYALSGEISTAISFVYIKKMDVFLYGAGKNIEHFIQTLLSKRIIVRGIVDVSSEKQGGQICNIPVISPERFIEEKSEHGNAFCFVYALISGMSEMHVYEILYKAGITKYYSVTEKEKAQAAAVYLDWIDSNRTHYYIDNKDNILRTLQILEDNISCEILNEYIRCYIECDYYRLPQICTKYKYFFGDEKRERIYTHLDNEVWLNFGADVGSTIFSFFENGFSCKKIIAVEGDNLRCRKLHENVSLLPEIETKVKVVNEFIRMETDIDKVVGKEKVTLIDADIEGYEMDMLKILSGRIAKDRPVLAVCLYHKAEDIVEIPQYIESIVKNYHYFIRKYESHFGDQKGVYELVLYAVPEERMPSGSMTQS